MKTFKQVVSESTEKRQASADKVREAKTIRLNTYDENEKFQNERKTKHKDAAWSSAAPPADKKWWDDNHHRNTAQSLVTHIHRSILDHPDLGKKVARNFYGDMNGGRLTVKKTADVQAVKDHIAKHYPGVKIK